jgi:hypothetical protein
MRAEERKRIMRVVNHVQAQLDRGVEYYDRTGKRLHLVASIIEANFRGGLVVKEPRNAEQVAKWMREAKAAPEGVTQNGTAQHGN